MFLEIKELYFQMHFDSFIDKYGVSEIEGQNVVDLKRGDFDFWYSNEALVG